MPVVRQLCVLSKKHLALNGGCDLFGNGGNPKHGEARYSEIDTGIDVNFYRNRMSR